MDGGQGQASQFRESTDGTGLEAEEADHLTSVGVGQCGKELVQQINIHPQHLTLMLTVCQWSARPLIIGASQRGSVPAVSLRWAQDQADALAAG